MAKLFSKMKRDGLEETKDFLGGYQALATDIYPMTIVAAYLTKSSKEGSEAQAINVIGKIGDQEYRETFWFTNAAGEHFRIDPKTKKKTANQNYNMIDELCLLATGESFDEQDFDDVTLKLYNPATRQQENQVVQAMVALKGAEVLVALTRTKSFKEEKVGEDYLIPMDPDARQERTVSTASKFFHAEYKMTCTEIREAMAHADKVGGDPVLEADFHDKWLNLYKGKDKDDTKKQIAKLEEKSGGASNGRPSLGGAKAGSSAPAGAKSLFGKKA